VTLRANSGLLSTPQVDRNNNFDLIRLFAALQVFTAHLISHLNLQTDGLTGLMAYVRMFPGVPIFFMLSGYLIFASASRGGLLVKYAQRRIARIFPGLWVSIAFTFAVLWAFGYVNTANVRTDVIWTWIAATGTFAQFWDHPFFAGWANGGVNGALWTLSVELQFYIFTPILITILKRVEHPTRWIWTLVMAAVVVNVATGLLPQELFITKLLKISLLPYLIYFCIGILAFIHREVMRRILNGRFILWISVYLVFVGATSVANQTHDASYFLNGFGLIGVCILSLVVFSAAYSARGLADRTLRGTDLSYGVYIYHMVVIGAFVEAEMSGWPVAGAALVLTLGIAALSWFAVERPCLSLSHSNSQRSMDAAAVPVATSRANCLSDGASDQAAASNT